MSQRRATYSVKPPRVSEHDEQAAFFHEVSLQYGFRDDFSERLLFAIPNGMWAGGKNPYALIAKFKAEGMKTGVADILYLQPRGDYAYLAIEMKAQDKRNDKSAVSDDQREFLESVKLAGGIGLVCYGCDEALAVFAAYMDLRMA